MAFEELLRTVTYEAGQDLSASQYLFVTQAADGQVDPTGSAVRASGILQNAPAAAGRAASVAIVGSICKLRASAAIARQALVTSTASGLGVTASTSGAVNAIALDAATAANDIITVQVLDGLTLAL